MVLLVTILSYLLYKIRSYYEKRWYQDSRCIWFIWHKKPCLLKTLIILLHKLKRPSDNVIREKSPFCVFSLPLFQSKSNKSYIKGLKLCVARRKKDERQKRKYRLLLLGRRKTDMSLIIQMKWKPNFSSITNTTKEYSQPQENET